MTKINILRLSSVHYLHPNLADADRFLRDFGLVEVLREETRIFYAGFGIDPYLYLAEQSPDGRRKFLGATWVVAELADLETAAAHPSSTGIVENDGPGGGRKVSITDPNGFSVTLIHGQQLRAEASWSEQTRVKPPGDSFSTDDFSQNLALEKNRRGTFKRFSPGPSPVHKLGHYGFTVPADKYKETMTWYTQLLNLKPTDAIYKPETGEEVTCFLHIDHGTAYTDHHSFFLGASPVISNAHVHHSSFEVHDFDTQCLGHDWLQHQGWTNCWGVGRHLLGSQIFDYWFDSSGNIVEHYSDGDLVNADTAFSREVEAPGSIYVWGPNLPLAMMTGKMEDAGKPLH